MRIAQRVVRRRARRGRLTGLIGRGWLAGFAGRRALHGLKGGLGCLGECLGGGVSLTGGSGLGFGSGGLGRLLEGVGEGFARDGCLLGTGLATGGLGGLLGKLGGGLGQLGCGLFQLLGGLTVARRCFGRFALSIRLGGLLGLGGRLLGRLSRLLHRP